MTQPLSPEDEARYTAIIDGILEAADLLTVTRKKIRMGLEDALGGKDLSEQKSAIKSLIEARFDAVSNALNSNDMPPSSHPEPYEPRPAKRQANGHSPSDDEDANGEIEVSLPLPSKKKQKRESSEEDADARLAAELQAQENRLARARTTRGNGGSATSRVAKKKKAPRKKSSKKVKAGDDSDVEANGEESPAKGKGFQKPFNLSYQLADLCGEPQLSRPQVVKRLWAHIKANELQDPKDKRQIRCDDKMMAVFKLARVDMFQMNKFIGNHLYPVDEE